MGAVQSDLKASIVQASSGGQTISPKDDDFWQIFWTRPETPEHVFETFTSTDIRAMRDDPTAFDNLKTLVLKTSLLVLRYRYLAQSLSEESAATGIELLNCVRILTRVLPYIYESDIARAWEESTFWQPQDPSSYERYIPKVSEFFDIENSLGPQLVGGLVDLLFYSGFTLPWPDSDGPASRKGMVTYGLWQSGIACDTTVVTSKDFESRRTEILQLLLVMESKGIYVGHNEYIHYDVQAVQYMVRHPDKRRVQSLLCSLLNTVLKYHPDSWLPFDPRNPQGDSVREIHVKTCLHFLLANILSRAPWDDSGRETNEFRLQFSALHKPKHFQFLADGIFKILRQPLEQSANVLSMGSKSVAWAPEMVLLLWEALYTNRKYLHYVVESGRALDLMVLLIYYAKDSQMEGIGRVCVFCLQTLSAEPGFAQLLNRRFEAHESLPVSIQIKNFHGKYSDYFITSTLSLLEYNPAEASFWSVSLASIINNIAPEVTGLARATSSKLLQTFARMAKPSFVLANETNIALLTSLLEAINTIVERHEHGHENENLLYAVWRARHRFESLRELSLVDEETLGSVEPASSASTPRPEQSDSQNPSEKARGKQPFVASNVSPDVLKHLPDLPLHTCLTLIRNLKEHTSSLSELDLTATTSADSRRSSFTSIRTATERPLAEVLQPIREAGTTGLEHQKSTLEVFRFQAPIAALYASFYWGLIVSSDVQRASGVGKGVWAGTNVKLFRIKAGQVQGPSLWSPKGAVDAVGESLVAGMKDLTLRARKGMSGENP